MLSRATTSMMPYAIAATAYLAWSRVVRLLGTPIRTADQSPGSFSIPWNPESITSGRSVHLPLALHGAPASAKASRKVTADPDSISGTIRAGGKKSGVDICVTVTNNLLDRQGLS